MFLAQYIVIQKFASPQRYKYEFVEQFSFYEILSRTLRGRVSSLCAMEIVVDFGLVVVSAGGRGIEQSFQQIGFYVSDVRGRVSHTVQNILDVAGVQLQKALSCQNCINLSGANPYKVLLRTQHLQHEVHDFIKVIVGVLPDQIVIFDIGLYLFSVSIHHIHR